MRWKRRVISGVFLRTFTNRHHVQERLKFSRASRKPIPYSLKYIDIVQGTNTTLDVLQEPPHIWLLERWWWPETIRAMDWFHLVHVLEFYSSARTYVVRGRLTKIQATSWPEFIGPEEWSNMSKNSQQKEKQHWAKEKPKHNTRSLRGICHIDPEDLELKENYKERAKKNGNAYGFSHAMQVAKNLKKQP